MKSVAILVGSDSDISTMTSCVEQLQEFGIDPVVRIISAHRTPQAADDFATSAAKNGIQVIIAAAGMAAHLAGALAGLAWPFYLGLAAAAAQLAWQAGKVDIDNPADCLAKFTSNNWLGAIIFAAIVAGRIVL